MRASYEPRSGGRVSVLAEIRTPQGTVLAISSHLEAYANCDQRVKQWNEIITYLDAHYPKVSPETAFPIVMGGDYATLHTLMGRFSNYHPRCYHRVFINTHHLFHSEAFCFKNSIAKALTQYRLSEPFSTNLLPSDSTYSTAFGLLRRKLDWLFYSDDHWTLKSKTIGGSPSASHHKFLLLNLEPK